MSTDKIEVKFTCEQCGGTVLEIPDDHTDDSIAKCKSCGVEFGRWGDIKAKAIQLAKGEVTSMVENAFKGLKGWTVK